MVPRIEMPPLADLTPEQRAVHDEVVAGLRGRVPAPMRAWIASPELARRAQLLGEFLRYQTTLPPRLSELAILVTARHWTSPFEWYAHKREALAAGLAPTVIDAIAGRREPHFEHAAEHLVYRFARCLHEDHAVDEELYRSAVERFGERAVVELVALLGYYSLVSMTLNAFAIDLPAGEPPGLEP